MDIDRAAALKRERDDVVAVCRGLTAEQWATPSRCDGWTVRDVVAHLAATCHGAFTPWVVKMMTSASIERGNDADVEKRRDRSPAEVLDEYERWSARFGLLQKPLQRQPLSSVPLRLGEFGTYPARLLTSAIVFDTQLHLRHDIASALGITVPPGDAERTAVSLEWMMAGLPTMSGGRLGWLDRPLQLSLTGAGGGAWFVVPGSKGKPAVTRQATPGVAATIEGVAATIEGVAADFAVWSTRREPWRTHQVTISGDEAYATRFLDDFQVV